MRVLAADIGGTHTRVALFEVRDGRPAPDPVLEHVADSGEHDGPVAPVREFLDGLDDEPAAACLALACPVTGEVCRFPNLGWEVDLGRLRREIGLDPTVVINDFDAVGHGVLLLGPDDLTELQAGEPEEGGALALIGPGTGLGHGFLTRAGEGYRVHASEGGHGDFAPSDPKEWRLREFLARRHGRASWERVLSGPGLVDIYRFLVSESEIAEGREARDRMKEEDPARVISDLALAGTDPLCQETMRIFLSVLGAQAGNLALTVQATGAVYIAGGIGPAILPLLQDGTFLRAFRDKGRMAQLMHRIPVRVILEPRVGLLGAASVAASLLGASGVRR